MVGNTRYKRISLFCCFVFTLACLLSCVFQGRTQAQESIEAHFSPGGGAQKAIVSRLEAARSEICVAMYIFSNQELADVLISAHRKGVKVRVLLDGSEDEYFYSQGRYLSGKGVQVRVDRSHMLFPGESQGIMHNKFAIVDNNTVITGSYNWTNAAEINNDENIIILHEAGDVARRYEAQFRKLWDRSVSYDVKELPEPLVISADDLEELRKHAGLKAYIVGVVHNVYYSERSGTYFLNFGPDRSSFTGIIFKSAAEKFAERGIRPKEYEKREVELYGKIIDHPKYGLEIIIEDPIQIRELSVKE